MFRMCARDFGVIHHKGGISPAWPISYADLEPFYTQAGFGSSYDPTEPFHSKPYPYSAFSNEPRMASIERDVRSLGVNTFPIPLGLKLDEPSLERPHQPRKATLSGLRLNHRGHRYRTRKREGASSP